MEKHCRPFLSDHSAGPQGLLTPPRPGVLHGPWAALLLRPAEHPHPSFPEGPRPPLPFPLQSPPQLGSGEGTAHGTRGLAPVTTVIVGAPRSLKDPGWATRRRGTAFLMPSAGSRAAPHRACETMGLGGVHGRRPLSSLLMGPCGTCSRNLTRDGQSGPGGFGALGRFLGQWSARGHPCKSRSPKTPNGVPVFRQLRGGGGIRLSCYPLLPAQVGGAPGRAPRPLLNLLGLLGHPSSY